MTDLDPCLLGGDLALAEADQLLRLLSDDVAFLDPELTAVRERIATLRREVERLRGLPQFLPGEKSIRTGLTFPARARPGARPQPDPGAHVQNEGS